jgi:hypothetical protein
MPRVRLVRTSANPTVGHEGVQITPFGQERSGPLECRSCPSTAPMVGGLLIIQEREAVAEDVR